MGFENGGGGEGSHLGTKQEEVESEREFNMVVACSLFRL